MNGKRKTAVAQPPYFCLLPFAFPLGRFVTGSGRFITCHLVVSPGSVEWDGCTRYVVWNTQARYGLSELDLVINSVGFRQIPARMRRALKRLLPI
jgi:hypothetical protein